MIRKYHKKILLLAVTFVGLTIFLSVYKIQKAYRQFTQIKALSVIKDPDLPNFTLKTISIHPHDKTTFTEGLVWYQGFLYESGGGRGRSVLRKVDLLTGKAVKSRKVPAPHFAEGITIFREKVYQLTWKSHTCFVYDADTLEKTGEFTYKGEGWGLTHDARYLIMSDGTHRLRFVDPDTFKTVRTLDVRMNGAIVNNLNELEFVEGMIYANVYITNSIVRIDPSTGNVTGLIDLTPLYEKMSPFSLSGINMPNGIAYDPETRAIYVTGKFWPKLFKVKIVPRGVSGGR